LHRKNLEVKSKDKPAATGARLFLNRNMTAHAAINGVPAPQIVGKPMPGKSQHQDGKP
jgi:hypothetical protein